MTKTRGFIYFGLFYICGIFINNLVESLYISLLVFFALMIFFLCLLLLYKKEFFIIGFVSILGFILGIYVSYYNLEQINYKLKIVDFFTEKESLEVEIKRISKVKEDKVVYIGKVLIIGDYKIDKKIDIEININGNTKIEKGKIIKFDSKAYKFSPFNNFQYDKYMYSNGIFFSVYPYSYKIIGEKKQNIISENIYKLRESILKNIKNIYTKQEAIFLGGILVGAREDMPEYLKNNFNNSGLTHIIAVSGFNITILIIFFSHIINFFPSYIRFSLVTLVIVLFTMLVGYNPPVIRAMIMGIIGYWVLISGRKANILSILILTAMIMIAYSPLSLNYDISLHLSFLAVLGIIYSQNFFEKALKFIPNFLEIRTALSITLSALLFTFPIMIFNFGQISIIAPISNILVAWTIPIIMLVSFIGLILYYLSPIFGIIVSYLAWLLLKWDIIIVNTFGAFKYSVIKYNFGENKGFFIFLYFLLIIFFIYYFKKKKIDY